MRRSDLGSPTPRGSRTSMSGGGRDDSDSDSEPGPNVFLLQHQNRSLRQELFESRKAIKSVTEESKRRELQVENLTATVSLIQRSWEQLENEARLLLNSITTPSVSSEIEGQEKKLRLQLEEYLVQTAQRFLLLDPTNQTLLPDLPVDTWMTEPELKRITDETLEQQSSVHDMLLRTVRRVSLSSTDIEIMRNSGAETEMKEAAMALDDANQNNDSDSECFELLGTPLEEHLALTAGSTLKLLTSLTDAVVKSQQDAQNRNSLGVAVGAFREAYAKLSLLSSMVTRLRDELVNVHCRLARSEGARVRLERRMSKIESMEIENSPNQVVDTAEQKSSMSTDGSTLPDSSSTTGITPVVVPAESKPVLAVLEAQLADAEAARIRLEKELNSAYAKELVNGGESSFVETFNISRQELTSQIDNLISRNTLLSGRVGELESAINVVEAGFVERIRSLEQSITETIAAKDAETVQLKASLAVARRDEAAMDRLIAERDRLSELVAEQNTRIAAADRRFASLQDAHKLLKGNLDDSRRREGDLTKLLRRTVPKRTHSSSDTTNPTSTDNTETNVLANIDQIDNVTLLRETLKETSRRLTDVERELDHFSKSQLSDAFAEVEQATKAADSARAKQESLMTNLDEARRFRDMALSESQRLEIECDKLRVELTQSTAEAERRMAVYNQQTELIAAMTKEEALLRKEFVELEGKLSVEISNSAQATRDKVETMQKLQKVTTELESVRKTCDSLKRRCDELTDAVAEERRVRAEEAREHAAKRARRAAAAAEDMSNRSANEENVSTGNGGVLKSEEASMLELAMGMLRCSVCKDRFKSAAIAKCYHLFCRECIDENLRTRSRKCPACGEKFGADDIVNIYFTH